MADTETGKFGGLLGSLKKMVFTEDYLESNTTAEAPKVEAPMPSISKPIIPQNTIVANAGGTGIATTNMASDEMIAKIYDLFESINKPGVDFFELWNAAEAMGGPTAINLQNAFTSFKVLGLDKNTLINSGENYVAELQSKLGDDIMRKSSDKDVMVAKLQNEKAQLQAAKNDLENQIKVLNTQLVETTNKLNQIDAGYQDELLAIDKKIQMGKNALNTVVSQITTVIQTIKTSVN
jgi:hypothetical protein